MTTTLQAEVRTSRGKGPARRLRAEGKIPAVLYGKGIDPTALTLSPKELEKALSGEQGRNQVFTLDLEGRTENAMVRDLEVHPVTRQLVHVDLYRVALDEPVDAVVPVTTKGRSVGVQKGGKLRVAYRTLPVRCVPGVIPVKIELDVSGVDVGEAITVADIAMPEGVTITMRPQQTVVSVFEERAKVEEAAAPGAAPAAAAAKPAGKK